MGMCEDVQRSSYARGRVCFDRGASWRGVVETCSGRAQAAKVKAPDARRVLAVSVKAGGDGCGR